MHKEFRVRVLIVIVMEVIDAIVASSRNGGWVRPGTAYLEPNLEREDRTEIQSSRDDLLLHAR